MEERPFRVVTNLRKAGRLDEAWNFGCPLVQQTPSDAYLKGAFFWVCYEYLKKLQEKIKVRAQSNHGNYTPTHDEHDRINFYLDWIFWLDIPPGGFEYRSLLLLFQRNLESIPKLVLLLVKYDPHLFEEEDKQPYQSERGESPSLMLKYTRKVARAWMDHEAVREIDIDQLLKKFEQARLQAKDRQHSIWLDYDEAKCLILAGRLEQAREFVIPVLRKKQSESWAWGALATTYREQDATIAISLFSKGICCAHDEKFALPLLKGIAPLLAANGHNKEASMCVQRATSCYEQNGWKLKPDLEMLQSEPWFDCSVNFDELPAFLKEQSKAAVDVLHGPSEQCTAIILNIHKSGKGFHVYRNRDNSHSVRLGLYKSKSPPRIGDYVRLTIASEDGLIISAKPCAPEPMDDVGIEEGDIRVAPKGFGFVNDTFVPPYLIPNGIDGMSVKIIKVRDFDKTKNRPAWKAIVLKPK